MSSLERIHYQISGPPGAAGAAAPKLVFLHGVMGFGINFRRIAKALEADFQVLLYDQRGHGRSFHASAGQYKPEDYASDLLEMIDALGWQKISLVGHSLGGRVASYFASHHAERLTRLVIEDIGPSMHASRTSLVIRLLDAVPTPFESKVVAQEWFKHEFLEIFAMEPGKVGLASYLYANLVEDSEKRAVWRFDEAGVRETIANGRKEDRWADFLALSMPTMFVRGEHSTDLPRDLYEDILKENARFQGVEIKNAAHWIHADQPEVFIDVLRHFLHDRAQQEQPGIEITQRG